MKTSNLGRYRRWLIVFLCASLAIISASASKSGSTLRSPGDLDTTFSEDGKLTDGLAHGYDSGNSVAIQPDGKIVVAGTGSMGNGHYGFSVARYNTDGSLDISFSNDGQVLTGWESLVGGASSVAIQSDGKIVAAGWAWSTVRYFAVVRYNPDGSLDNSFDSDGKVLTQVGTSEERAQAVAVQPNGKILLAGYARTSASGDVFALVRYNSDGSLDNSFDGDGIATTDILPGSYDRAFSIAVQANEKIIAAGQARSANAPSGDFDFALVRYNVDGSLDTGFDGDGKVTTPIGPGHDEAWSVAIQPDGKIVAAGISSSGAGVSPFDFAAVRYNIDGSLDTTFDGDGKVTTQIGATQDYGRAVKIQADGKIVVAGGSIDDILTFAAVRYNPNGSLDPTFDVDGKVTTAFSGGWSEAHAAAIQPDGKIIAVGLGVSYLDPDFAIARYNPDGSLDSTLNSDGKVTTDFGIWDGNSLTTIAVQADGKIVAVGNPALNGLAVARYKEDGSPDPAFGAGGKVLIRLPNWAPYDAAVHSDGKIVITGYEYDSGGGVIARLNPNGTLDTTFGGDGMVTDNLSGAGPAVIQPDGKIVAGVGGYSVSSTLIRYNLDGSVDPTFVINGDTIGFTDLALQSDGRILAIGGLVDGQNNYDFAITRFNPNGSLDTTFDFDGTAITPLGSYDFPYSLAIQVDGKIVVAGYSYNSSFTNSLITLVRYNPNGSLDTTFSDDGKVTTSIGDRDGASSVALQEDGKIVVAGTTYSVANDEVDFALLRYHVDGSLDATLGGGDGVTTLDFNNSGDSAAGLALDRRGRALVGGNSDGAFAIARFLLEANKTAFDFDGDGRSDLSVFRPSSAVWYLNRSTTGFTATQFGLASDSLAPADYDGDGKTDIAIFRDGFWWRIDSSDSTVRVVHFGQADDTPVSADYTGDGRDELAVYRNGQWWALDLSNNQSSLLNFGLATDKPFAADYDGDRRVDQAVYRNGEWHINRTTLGYTVAHFGLSSDRPVVGDYDGDGRADLAVYRDGTWYLQQSTAGFSAFQWGLPTDVPAPGDYDGDGKADAAVYRDGVWYLLQTTGGISIQQFGLAGDMPLPAAYSP